MPVFGRITGGIPLSILEIQSNDGFAQPSVTAKFGLCGFISIYPTPVRLPSFYRLCDGGIDNVSYHGLFTTFAVIVACKTWWGDKDLHLV